MQSVLPFAMRMPDATHVQNHAIAAWPRTTGKGLSSLSSDATSSEILKRLFTMEVTRRAKATGVTLTAENEVFEDSLCCVTNQGRTNFNTNSSTGTTGRN